MSKHAPNTMARVRWGLMSTARINARLIPGLRRSDRSEVIAVASRSTERAEDYAAEWKIPRAYGSYADLLLDPDVDAVYISLPNSLHLKWAVRSAEAGKHVLCEKPLALTAADVGVMQDAARRNGVTLQEATMMRYHAQTLHVRELVSGGAIGEIRAMHGVFHNKLTNDQDIRLDPKLGGGSLWDLGSYSVNFMRTMVGAEPIQVHAWQVSHSTGVDVSFTAHMRFATGMTAQFQCGFDAMPHTEADIVGSMGMIHLDLPWVNRPGESGNVRIVRIGQDPQPGGFGDSPADAETETLTYENVDPYRDQMAAVVATILDGAAPVISAEDSRRNIAVIEALYRSARTGGVVTL